MRCIWVDTDLALGSPRGDVDDGFALAAVLRAVQREPARFKLLGVSAVGGNTSASTAFDCARKLLQQAGATQVPLVAAADAPAAIAALPAGASVLALGPLTNVARALVLDPGLATRTELRTVGGVMNHWQHPLLRFFCLNFRTDPLAAQQVVAAHFTLRRSFPLDVVKRLAFGRLELEQIAVTGALGCYLTEHSWRWLKQAPWRYASNRFAVWDLVAALDAVDQLANPRYDRGGQRLVDFDVAASFGRLLALLRTPAYPTGELTEPACQAGFSSAPHAPA